MSNFNSEIIPRRVRKIAAWAAMGGAVGGTIVAGISAIVIPCPASPLAHFLMLAFSVVGGGVFAYTSVGGLLDDAEAELKKRIRNVGD